MSLYRLLKRCRLRRLFSPIRKPVLEVELEGGEEVENCYFNTLDMISSC